MSAEKKIPETEPEQKSEKVEQANKPEQSGQTSSEHNPGQSASESKPASESKSATEQPKKKRNFLAIYGLSLLVIALVLLALSFFQSQRANEQIENLRAEHSVFSTSALKSIDELRASVDELEAQNEALRDEQSTLSATNSRLATENAALREELTEAQQELEGAQARLSEREKYFVAADDGDTALALVMWAVADGVDDRDYAEAAELAAGCHAEIFALYAGAAEESLAAELYDDYADALETLERRGWVELERDEDGEILGVALSD